MLLRAELRGMVASQLEELAASELRRTEAVQGLLERFGSLLERAEIALERLSTLPPLAGIGGGCADGGFEPFGCYSPRKTNPVGELVQELVGMMSGSSGNERRGCRLDREEIMQEVHVELPQTVTGEVIS